MAVITLRRSKGSALTYDEMDDNFENINNAILGVTVTKEVFTATEGQTVFTLTAFSNVPGSNRLIVYINGLKQHASDYTETSATVITLSEGAELNDRVEMYFYS